VPISLAALAGATPAQSRSSRRGKLPGLGATAQGDGLYPQGPQAPAVSPAPEEREDHCRDPDGRASSSLYVLASSAAATMSWRFTTPLRSERALS